MVRLVLMDMEFEKIKEDFTAVEVNTTAEREHVGEIERAIRFVKERLRCVVSTLRDAGFRYYHHMVIIHGGVYFVVTMINGLPAPKKILGVMSPREIVTGRKLDFKKDCRAPFGAYIEASVDADVTNDMSPRARGSLSLGPAGNLQGSLKCFDLDTG